MIIYVDIDETICETPGEVGKPRDYNLAKPWISAIESINKLYDQGHQIIIWTARGVKTGINWKHTTNKQLKEWGVKYHRVSFRKPYYDMLIDDKSITMGGLIFKELMEKKVDGI